MLTAARASAIIFEIFNGGYLSHRNYVQYPTELLTFQIWPESPTRSPHVATELGTRWPITTAIVDFVNDTFHKLMPRPRTSIGCDLSRLRGLSARPARTS